MLRKLKWVRDGDGLWDLDMSTPATLNGVARAVPGGEILGLSRGIRLSRPKQVDFFQRFMFMPFIPSYSYSNHNTNGDGGGFCVQRVLSLPTFNLHRWFGSVLGQFNLQKFASNVIQNKTSSSTWFDSIVTHLTDKSLYAVDLASEFFLSPNDSLLLSLEQSYHHRSPPPRKKAVFHHKFAHHDLTLEAATPGLFVDNDGALWDVPLTMALDLASIVSSDNAPSYHLCLNHNTGQPKPFRINQSDQMVPPASLFPGFSATTAFSFKNTIDIWTSSAPKLKMVQPYDIFLSNPHISATGIIGGVMTACFGDNLVRVPPHDSSKGLAIRKGNSALLADSFATVSLSAQLGTFQKMFFDLTRFQALLDFPSGSTFVSGAARLAKDAYNSQQYNIQAIQKICPNTTLSFQQQLVGPFSFRVDTGVELDLKKKGDDILKIKDPIFAVEYALHVLGSAKAVAWYSPRQKEFMIELRFFET